MIKRHLWLWCEGSRTGIAMDGHLDKFILGPCTAPMIPHQPYPTSPSSTSLVTRSQSDLRCRSDSETRTGSAWFWQPTIWPVHWAQTLYYLMVVDSLEIVQTEGFLGSERVASLEWEEETRKDLGRESWMMTQMERKLRVLFIGLVLICGIL